MAGEPRRVRGAHIGAFIILQARRAQRKFPFKTLLGILAAIIIVVGIWSVVSPPELPKEWTDWFAADETAEPAYQPAPDLDLPKSDQAVGEVTFPSFDVVRVTRGGTGVIAGRAEPMAMVEVLANGQSIGMVQADSRGEWVLIFDDPLQTGGSELSLTSTMPGKDAIESPNIVVVVVPEREETGFAPSGDEGVVAIRTPRNGQGRSTILQKPRSSPDFGGGLMLETLEYDEDGKATISGRAAARSDVRIYLDNELISTVVSNDDSRWVMQLDQSVPPGDHVLRLDQVIEEGEVQLRLEVPFNRTEPVDLSRSEGSIVVRPGNNLWQISRKLYGTGFRYTVIFGANRDNIKDPDLIYPGQVFALPKSDAPSESDAPSGSDAGSEGNAGDAADSSVADQTSSGGD